MSVGYKKCADDRIVKLEILGETNENRDSIVGPEFASMRCSEAKVLSIYDVHSDNAHEIAYSLYDPDFEYKVGQVVKADDFEPDINVVHAPGIHYYLSEEPALHYEHECCGETKNGVYKEWHDNGVMKLLCNYIDNKLDGEFKRWHENENLMCNSNYSNGRLNGEFSTWYENGNKNTIYHYIDGVHSGEHNVWHENGNLKCKTNYLNGLFHGEGSIWNENGELEYCQNFVNGELI